MLERLIEMVKGRKEEIFVAFLDMEKSYDRVNRKKLFEVLRCYGVYEKLVRLIEIIYDGSFSVNLASSAVTLAWSVHKSSGDNVGAVDEMMCVVCVYVAELA